MVSGFSINQEVANLLDDLIEGDDRVLVELGSGEGTPLLLENFTVYSIEDNAKYWDLYPTNYIKAPLKNAWYDVAKIKEGLPEVYDAILVDGPVGRTQTSRHGFLKNLDLFNAEVPIFIDDMHRPGERDLFNKLCAKLKREGVEVEYGDVGKIIGVIIP